MIFCFYFKVIFHLFLRLYEHFLYTKESICMILTVLSFKDVKVNKEKQIKPIFYEKKCASLFSRKTPYSNVYVK